MFAQAQAVDTSASLPESATALPINDMLTKGVVASGSSYSTTQKGGKDAASKGQQGVRQKCDETNAGKCSQGSPGYVNNEKGKGGSGSSATVPKTGKIDPKTGKAVK